MGCRLSSRSLRLSGRQRTATLTASLGLEDIVRRVKGQRVMPGAAERAAGRWFESLLRADRRKEGNSALPGVEKGSPRRWGYGFGQVGGVGQRMWPEENRSLWKTVQMPAEISEVHLRVGMCLEAPIPLTSALQAKAWQSISPTDQSCGGVWGFSNLRRPKPIGMKGVHHHVVQTPAICLEESPLFA